MSESRDDSEVYPEGYLEALADCTVLAARLLKRALDKQKESMEDTKPLDR